MIRHWIGQGEEVYALYRRVSSPEDYLVCQFDPHPNFHNVLKPGVEELESNEDVVAVDDSEELPEDVRAALVQDFDLPGGGTGQPTPGS